MGMFYPPKYLYTMYVVESFRGISLIIIGIKILPHKLFGIIVKNDTKLIATLKLRNLGRRGLLKVSQRQTRLKF